MTITTDPTVFRETLVQNFIREQTLPNSCDVRKHRDQRQATYTVNEAAKRIHPSVASTAIYAAIEQMNLKARKVGKQYIITEEAIQEYLSWREEENHHGYGRGRTKASGSSSMGTSTSGQDAVLRSVSRLKKLSANT